jgi:hypothetical protein
MSNCHRQTLPVSTNAVISRCIVVVFFVTLPGKFGKSPLHGRGPVSDLTFAPSYRCTVTVVGLHFKLYTLCGLLVTWYVPQRRSRSVKHVPVTCCMSRVTWIFKAKMLRDKALTYMASLMKPRNEKSTRIKAGDLGNNGTCPSWLIHLTGPRY